MQLRLGELSLHQMSWWLTSRSLSLFLPETQRTTQDTATKRLKTEMNVGKYFFFFSFSFCRCMPVERESISRFPLLVRFNEPSCHREIVICLALSRHSSNYKN